MRIGRFFDQQRWQIRATARKTRPHLLRIAADTHARRAVQHQIFGFFLMRFFGILMIDGGRLRDADRPFF